MTTISRTVRTRRTVEWTIPAREPYGADWTEVELAVHKAARELAGAAENESSRAPASDAIRFRIAGEDDDARIIVYYVLPDEVDESDAQRTRAFGPHATATMPEATLRVLRNTANLAYGGDVERDARMMAAASALDELRRLQDVEVEHRELVDALRVLCPCDPNSATTDGPLEECPVHGLPSTAVELLRLGAEFRGQVFDHRAWERGRAWAHSTMTDRAAPLAAEAVAAQDRHYVRQVSRYGELISRMMGRLVGFREGVAELADRTGEGRAAWRRRA